MPITYQSIIDQFIAVLDVLGPTMGGIIVIGIVLLVMNIALRGLRGFVDGPDDRIALGNDDFDLSIARVYSVNGSNEYDSGDDDYLDDDTGYGDSLDIHRCLFCNALAPISELICHHCGGSMWKWEKLS